jgi:hypothetical protein
MEKLNEPMSVRRLRDTVAYEHGVYTCDSSDANELLRHIELLTKAYVLLKAAEVPAAATLIKLIEKRIVPGDRVLIRAQGHTIRGLVKHAQHWDGQGWDLEYTIENPLPGHIPYGRWKQWTDGGELELLT